MYRKKLAKECKDLLLHLLRLLSCFDTNSRYDESYLSCVVTLLRKVMQELSKDDRRHVLKNGVIDMKEAINELGSQFLRLTIRAIRHEDDVKDFLSHLDVDLKLIQDLFDGNVLHATNVAVQAGITLIEENRSNASIQSRVICSLASTVFQDYLPKVRQTSEVGQWYAVLLGSLWLKESKKKARKKVQKIISQVLPLDTLCRVRVQGPNGENYFKTKTAKVLIEMNLEELKRFVPEVLQSLDVGCTVVRRKEWVKDSRKVFNVIKAVLVTAVDTLSIITKQFEEKLKEESIEIIGKLSGCAIENCRHISLLTNVERQNEEKNTKEVGDRASKKGDQLIKHECKAKAGIDQVANMTKCTERKNNKKNFVRYSRETTKNSESRSRELVLGNECDTALNKNSGPSSQITPDGECSNLKPDANLCGNLAKSIQILKNKKYALNTPSPRSAALPDCEKGRNHGRVQCNSSLAQDQLFCDKAGKNKGMKKQVSFLPDPVGNSVENCELEFLEASQLSSGRPGSLDGAVKNKMEDSVCAVIDHAHSITTEKSLAQELSTADVHSQELMPVKNDETDSHVLPGGLDSITCSSKAQPEKHPLDTKNRSREKIDKALKTQLNNLILSLESDSDFEVNHRETAKFMKSGTVLLQKEGGGAIYPQPNGNDQVVCMKKFTDKQEKCNRTPKHVDIGNYDADNINKNIDKQGKLRTFKNIDIDDKWIFPSFDEAKNGRSNSKVFAKRIGLRRKRDVMECVTKNRINEITKQSGSERSSAQNDYERNREVLTCRAPKERLRSTSAKPASLCLPDSLAEELELGNAVEDNDGIPEGWRRILHPRLCFKNNRIASKVDVKVHIPGKKGHCRCPKELKKYLLKEGKKFVNISITDIFKISSVARANVSEIQRRMIARYYGGSSKKSSNCKKTTSSEKIKPILKVSKLGKKNYAECNEDNQCEKICKLAGRGDAVAGEELILPASVGLEPQGRSEGETEGKVNMDIDSVLETEFTLPLENASCVVKNSQNECVREYNECEKSLSGVAPERRNETHEEELTGNNFSKYRDPQVEDTNVDGQVIKGDEQCHILQEDLNVVSVKCARNGDKRKFDISQENLNVLNVDYEGGEDGNCKKIKIETSLPITEGGFSSALSAPSVGDVFISAFSSPDIRSSPASKTNSSDTGAFFSPSETHAVRYSAVESGNNACEFAGEFSTLGDKPNHRMTRIAPTGMFRDASTCKLSLEEKNTSEEDTELHRHEATSSPCSGWNGVNCTDYRSVSHINWEKDNIKCETDCRHGNSVIDFIPDYTPRIQRIKVGRDPSSGIEHALVPIPQSARSGNILVEIRYHQVFPTPCKTPQLLDSSCYVLPCEKLFDVAEHHRGCSRNLMNQFASNEENCSGTPQQNKVRKSFSDSPSEEDFSLCLMPDTPEGGNVEQRSYYCLNSRKTEREAQVKWKPSALFRNSNPDFKVNQVSKGNQDSANSPDSAYSTVLSEKPNEELVLEVKQSCSPLSQPKSRHCSAQALEAVRRTLRLASCSQRHPQSHLCINHRTQRSSLKRLSWSHIDLYCPVCVMAIDDLALCTYYIDVQGMIPVDVVTSSQESNGELTRQAEYESYVNTIKGAFPSFNDFLPKDLPSKCDFHGITRPDWRPHHQSTLNSEFIDPSFLTTAGSIPTTSSTQDTTAGQAVFESTGSRLDNVPRTTEDSTSCIGSRHFTDIFEELSDIDGIASPSCTSEDLFGPLDLKDLDIERIEKAYQVQKPSMENQTKPKDMNYLSFQKNMEVERMKSSKKRQKVRGVGFRNLEFRGSLDSETLTCALKRGNKTPKKQSETKAKRNRSNVVANPHGKFEQLKMTSLC